MFLYRFSNGGGAWVLEQGLSTNQKSDLQPHPFVIMFQGNWGKNFGLQLYKPILCMFIQKHGSLSKKELTPKYS